MPKSLLHVTLRTGHRRSSPKHEVGSEVLEILAPLLERALEGQHVGVPQLPGYTWSAASAGRCCVVTLWAQTSEGGPPEPVPILTIGVAGDDVCGADLWRLLHETGGPYATNPATTPPTPWVADRLETAMSRHVDAATWTGDWARCIGWAWLERVAP